MSPAIENLLKNSRLPGPRGNLELLYSFSKSATENEVNECFSYYRDDLGNSPEEFAVMCGIVGYCILHRDDPDSVLTFIRKYATHSSWRIRESVAIGIQEIAQPRMDRILLILENWLTGDDLEKRAVVAALCEPKLLKEKQVAVRVLKILHAITAGFEAVSGRLSDRQQSLRKALGYGWSVAVAALPREGKAAFEEMASSANTHIRWIVRENLKKNRLMVMDKEWVEKMS